MAQIVASIQQPTSISFASYRSEEIGIFQRQAMEDNRACHLFQEDNAQDVPSWQTNYDSGLSNMQTPFGSNGKNLSQELDLHQNPFKGACESEEGYGGSTMNNINRLEGHSQAPYQWPKMEKSLSDKNWHEQASAKTFYSTNVFDYKQQRSAFASSVDYPASNSSSSSPQNASYQSVLHANSSTVSSNESIWQRRLNSKQLDLKAFSNLPQDRRGEPDGSSFGVSSVGMPKHSMMDMDARCCSSSMNSLDGSVFSNLEYMNALMSRASAQNSLDSWSQDSSLMSARQTSWDGYTVSNHSFNPSLLQQPSSMQSDQNKSQSSRDTSSSCRTSEEINGMESMKTSSGTSIGASPSPNITSSPHTMSQLPKEEYDDDDEEECSEEDDTEDYKYSHLAKHERTCNRDGDVHQTKRSRSTSKGNKSMESLSKGNNRHLLSPSMSSVHPSTLKGIITKVVVNKGSNIEQNSKDEGETRHLCPQPGCDKHFSTSGHARRHSRIHASLRPFECPHSGCGATFTRRDNCTSHQRARHRNFLKAHRITSDQKQTTKI